MSLYDSLYLNNCWRYENQTFFARCSWSLRSKNLNAKIKEINVLLNFSQMFNMQTLGYMAHIETVFHFLPNSNKHIGIDDYRGFSYPSLQIIHWRWKRRNVDQASYISAEKKSHGVRPGDLGGQCRSPQSSFPARPIHLLCRVAFRYSLTTRLQWDGAPSYWKKKSASSPSNKSSINQFRSISRYASLLTVVPLKKKGPCTRFFDMAQNTFTLGESRTCSSV